MDELKLLDHDELKNVEINKQEAIDKGLIKGKNYKTYLQIQSLYKKAFDNYIKDLIQIDIDQKLRESNLDYGILKENQKHNFHKFSYLGSDYLFVRNFFYIERLKEKELEIFKEKINKGNFEIDDEVKEIVKNTFKQIIKARDNNENLKVFYDYVVPVFEFYNNSLVLYLNYGRNTIEKTGIEFIQNKIKKEIYLDKILKEISEDLTEKLKCKVETKWCKGII